jgi:LPPG:FO 2-phospho-L-lactate transferase
MSRPEEKKRIVALTGGVGGSKLALGFYLWLKAQGRASDLTVIGNTGDDLELFGVRICPDLDTLMYTLAGVSNRAQGWGLEGDTYHTLEMLKQYGEDGWFLLGDRDFATHLLRTRWLREGLSLTEITALLSKKLGIEATVLPMCNEDIRTFVETPDGKLPFQEYFVRRRASVSVTGLSYRGADKATLSPQIIEAIKEAQLVVICPSNPYLSVQPVLEITGMRELLVKSVTPLVAVSPIVGGKAIKGPAADIMQSLTGEASALEVARFYRGLVNGFVLDEQDAELKSEIEALGFRTLIAQTVMRTDTDKQQLAARILEESWQK